MKKTNALVMHKTDILFFFLSVIISLLLIGKPKTDRSTGMQAGHASSPASPIQAGEASSQSGKAALLTKATLYGHLDKRNVFSEDGSYEKELKKIPENAYNLIAVLKGREKRAIFREYTGTLVSVKVGDKLIDGAVVTDIGSMTVRVKKDKDKKEYRIFDVKQKK